jgi:hypothetical protein
MLFGRNRVKRLLDRLDDIAFPGGSTKKIGQTVNWNEHILLSL